MENPRPEKVAVVDEVRDRLSNSQAALLTEYRGIGVADLSALRRSLREAGGEYKVFKNTLVRFAARDLGIDIDDLLTGPTAIAFVPADSTGDPVQVAKALREFGKTNANLIVKGGVLGDKKLSAADAAALADVAPREVLLAQFAGALQAPMAQMAGLLQAPMREMAGLLKALLEDKGGSYEPSDASDADTDTDSGADGETETPVAETAAETPAADEAAEPTDAGEAPADSASKED